MQYCCLSTPDPSLRVSTGSFLTKWPLWPLFMQYQVRPVILSLALCFVAALITSNTPSLQPDLTRRLKCSALLFFLWKIYAYWFAVRHSSPPVWLNGLMVFRGMCFLFHHRRPHYKPLQTARCLVRPSAPKSHPVNLLWTTLIDLFFTKSTSPCQSSCQLCAKTTASPSCGGSQCTLCPLQCDPECWNCFEIRLRPNHRDKTREDNPNSDLSVWAISRCVVFKKHKRLKNTSILRLFLLDDRSLTKRLVQSLVLEHLEGLIWYEGDALPGSLTPILHSVWGSGLIISHPTFQMPLMTRTREGSSASPSIVVDRFWDFLFFRAEEELKTSSRI